MPHRVLLVEDDQATLLLLAEGLQSEHFETLEATSATAARQVLGTGEVDVAVIDVGLPDASGFELLRDAAAASVPVIMLSGRSGEADRILGLELGAEDYVVKPFSVRELAARLRRVLRTARTAAPRVEFGDLTIDLPARKVELAGQPVDLTRREFDLLAHLASQPGVVCTREDLLLAVWRSSAEWQTPATVTEHVRRLRTKLEADPVRPRHLVTVRGVGYRFDR